MARWRFFGVSKKCLKKTLLVCVAPGLRLFLRFFCFFNSFRVLFVFALLHVGPLRMFEKNAFTTRVSTF